MDSEALEKTLLQEETRQAPAVDEWWTGDAACLPAQLPHFPPSSAFMISTILLWKMRQMREGK